MDQVLSSLLKQGITPGHLRPVDAVTRRVFASATTQLSPKGSTSHNPISDQLIEELRAKRPVLRHVQPNNLPPALGGTKPPTHVVEEKEMEQGKRPVSFMKELSMSWNKTNTQGEHKSAVEMVNKRISEDAAFEAHLKQIRERRSVLLNNKEKALKVKEYLRTNPVVKTTMAEHIPKGANGVWSPRIPLPPPPPPLAVCFGVIPPKQLSPISTSPLKCTSNATINRSTVTKRVEIHSSILNNPVRNTLLEQYQQRAVSGGVLPIVQGKTKVYGVPALRLSSEDSDYTVVSNSELQSVNGNEKTSSSWFGWWFW